MITIQAGYASYGFGPAKTTVPAPAARTGVYIGAAMSMPLWKCAQPALRRLPLEPGAAEVLGDVAGHRPDERAVVGRRDVAAIAPAGG